MKISQLSVFLENRPFILKEVTALFDEHNFKIAALTLSESKEYGVLRVVVDRPAEALRLLNNHGFRTDLTEVAAVEVSDDRGGLAHILRLLCENEIEIEYMYGFMEQKADRALLIFRFSDLDKAIDLLVNNGVKIIGRKEIHD